MHTIVNCMADGVLVTNREAEVVLCNTTLKQLLGLSGSAAPARPLRSTSTTTPSKRPSRPCWRAPEQDPGQVHLPGT